ncbi:MAG: hypothetical protein Q9224_005058 [Gallowayella concinna]
MSEDVSLKVKSLESNTLMTDCSAQKLATPTGVVMRNKPECVYHIWYEFSYAAEHIFKASPNDTQQAKQWPTHCRIGPAQGADMPHVAGMPLGLISQYVPSSMMMSIRPPSVTILARPTDMRARSIMSSGVEAV